WRVTIFCDVLAGAAQDAPEILDACRERMLEQGWDLAICLTDLPINGDGEFIAAYVSITRRTAGITLPILGVVRLRRQVREAILLLVDELYCKLYAQNSARGGAGKGKETDAEAPSEASRLRRQRSRHRIGGGLANLVSPIRRIAPPDEGMKKIDVDVRFACPWMPGYFRLLPGMVLANRPWHVIASFKRAIAAASATAIYVLLLTSFWKEADALGGVRLTVFAGVSITSMVVWIVIVHSLWEQSVGPHSRRLATLYNAATVLTFTMAVLFAYGVLFALILAAAGLFAPADYFQSTLGHPVSAKDYLNLAWMTTSLATMAGALGSGLEAPDTVRNSTYWHRQRHRAETQHASDSAKR
ncbi:MAG TPA: hypothetical protein VFJ01_08555, partial [Oleiagrimonas sp.]|nr:hypothetical protein [Oleiagrimonas sp.]